MNTAHAVRVRRAAADDAVILATLRFEFRSAIGDAIELPEEFVARCESWMRDRLSDSDFWFAWIAETMDEGGPLAIGAIWLQLIEKVPNPVIEKEAHAYVTNLFVMEAERGRGAGSMLLEAAIAECRTWDVDTIILWPTPRSRALYERFRFAPAKDIMARVL
jgi:GNAT superfamily N-acetyltransferase